MTFKVDDVDHAWRTLVQNIVMSGISVSPRGLKTREIDNVILEYPRPGSYSFINEKRRINPVFHLVELFYFLNGRTDGLLADYIDNMKNYENEQNRFDGSYGPSIYESLPFAISELQNDPSSRRAVIPIIRSHHLNHNSIDIPCNVFLQFRINNETLEMLVVTRSQDLFRGFLYDTLEFQLLQYFLSKVLFANVGCYYHYISSLHLYENDFSNAIESLSVPDLSSADEPKILKVFNNQYDFWDYSRMINIQSDLAANWPDQTNDFDDISRAIINWKLRRKCLSSGLYSDWVNWWLENR